MSERAALTDRVLAAIDRDAAIDLLRRAVATPSITGDEAAIARLLRDELAAIGMDEVEQFDFAPGRANTWGRWGAGNGPRLLVVGHTDTVGSNAYNDALGQRRANSVANAIKANGKEVAGATSDGKRNLAVKTGDGVREPLNRRAVISVVK